MVCEGDGANAGEDKVLCDFVGERLDGDEEDVGGADSGGVSGAESFRWISLTSLALSHPIVGSGGHKARFRLP